MRPALVWRCGGRGSRGSWPGGRGRWAPRARRGPGSEVELHAEAHEARRAVGEERLAEVAGGAEEERHQLRLAGDIAVVVEIGPLAVELRLVRDRLRVRDARRATQRLYLACGKCGAGGVPPDGDEVAGVEEVPHVDVHASREGPDPQRPAHQQV